MRSTGFKDGREPNYGGKEKRLFRVFSLGTGWRLVVKGNGGWAGAFKAAAGYPEAGSENAQSEKSLFPAIWN